MNFVPLTVSVSEDVARAAHEATVIACASHDHFEMCIVGGRSQVPADRLAKCGGQMIRAGAIMIRELCLASGLSESDAVEMVMGYASSGLRGAGNVRVTMERAPAQDGGGV